MAPHLTPAELDWVHRQVHLGKTPVQIHSFLTARRARRAVATPDLTALRKAIKGSTHWRGLQETRGRKRTYSRKWVRALNTARKKLLSNCAHRREVRWSDVVKKARAPRAHRTTVKRAFDREGLKVAARRHSTARASRSLRADGRARGRASGQTGGQADRRAAVRAGGQARG